MKDEFSDRHQAIKMRLAGQSVEVICQTMLATWFIRHSKLYHFHT